MGQQQFQRHLGQLSEKRIGLLLDGQQAGGCPAQQMALQEKLLFGLPVVGRRRLIRFARFGFLGD